MRHPPLWAAAFALALAAGCGDNDLRPSPALHTATPAASATATHTPPPDTPTPTASPTPTPTPTTAGALALFSTDPLDPDNPFPSDRLLDGAGQVRVTGAMLDPGFPDEPRYDRPRLYLATIAGQLSTLGAFSTYAPIRVPVDRAVVLPAGGDALPAALLLERDRPEMHHPIEIRALDRDTAGREAVEIQPRLPLRENTAYVYVVTTAVRAAAGGPLRPDPELVEALSSPPAGLLGWRAALEPALEHLERDLGIGRDRIALIDTFTTQPVTADLVSIRQLLDGGSLPPPEPNFTDSPFPDLELGIFEEGSAEFADLTGSPTSDVLAAVAVGTFRSFDFRTGRGQAFDPARVAGEVVPEANELVFYVSVPKAPPPPGGYPLILTGHGLGGEGKFAIDIAPLLGDTPVMLIGTSAVEHGRRGNLSGFFNLGNVFATRDNFRQTIADFLQMERMARLSTAPPFDQVNRDRIHYFGVSLGGILGTLYMAVEPDVQVGMLSVPGGGLPRILDSPAIGSQLNPLIALSAGLSADDPFFPIFLRGFQRISQWPIDPADPINYAPYVSDPDRRLPGVAPKRVLVHEGIVDTVVPNATTDALAAAMGLPDLKASRGCRDPHAGCRGIWRFVMAEYGQAPDSGHIVTFLLPEAFTQALEFLMSDGTEVVDASPGTLQAAAGW